MLGPYGETLVVDWGLAKPWNQAWARNGTGRCLVAGRGPDPAVGAERLAGRYGGRLSRSARRPMRAPSRSPAGIDLLGPASDVYGLGATLYSL